MLMMLRKAAWLALKIEVVLFLILAASILLTGVSLHPGPDSRSLMFVYVPLLFQFSALWLLSPDLHMPMVLLVPLVFLVQYLTYTVIVFLVLLWRANP
jgi:hypothetical protein